MLAALSALFFASGAAALIYQVVWLRELGLIFGVTVHAAAAVLATFMAGLAAGSFIAGRVASRVRHPLRWFAGAESGVALTALASPFILASLHRAYVSIQSTVPDSLAVLTAVRVVMTALTLLGPTILMGSTLPLILRSSLVRGSSLGPRLGILYASNTTGAIAGTLIAALYLVPSFGLFRALTFAAAVNLVVALSALLLAVTRFRSPVDVDARSALPAETTGSATALRRAVLIVFALSGFVSLAAEVVWFRVAVLIIRPTVYAFGIMLATVLGGIALGSYLVSPCLGRRRDWVFILIVVELLLGIAICLGPPSLTFLPAAHRSVHPWLAMVMPPYLTYLVVASALMILPSALCMGVAFPIGATLYGGQRDGGHAAQDVGRFYSLNVCGSIAGSLLAGFVMLPMLGSRNSTLVLAILTVVSGLILAPRTTAGTRRGAWIAGAAAAAAIALFAAWLPHPQTIFLRQRFPGQRIIWSEEGVQSTVSVHEYGGTRSLHIDGNHQASTSGGTVTTHRRIGVLGLAVHPDPRDVLIIGLGGGATAGAASRFPFATVDVVELSEPVVRGAAFFESVNQGVLGRRTVRLRIDDGRNHLLLTDRRYDVIAADLILPIHAGAGNVYSQEYFRLARNALKDGGVVVQWVAGTRQEYALIARTFVSVFPYTSVWSDGSLMVGSTRPLRIARSDFEWKLQVPDAREALASVGFDTFERLKRQYRASADELRRFVGDGPLLTDDRPLVEYFLSLERGDPPDLSVFEGLNAPFVN